MAKIIKIFGLAFLAFSNPAFSQTNRPVEIKGIILDAATQTPLLGASVVLEEERTGVVSDSEGRFSISAKRLPATLEIRYLGYENKEQKVGDAASPLQILLKEDAGLLNEVVVVGYGTQKRKELTGAISTVSQAHLDYNVAPSVDALLGGAVAGVNVTQSSGQPGAPAAIRVRGGNSINAGNDPLYVIDGFLFFSDNTSTKTGIGSIEGESNPLNLLNPSDIESIEVLKDVSATAIYGSRGSNGVILITTKKGKKGSSSINYQYSTAWSKSAKKLDLLNAQQWARLQKDYFLNKPGYSDSDIAQLGAGYDWQSAVLQTGLTQNHSLSISGGDEKTQYFLSGGYLNQEGIVLNSGFERFVGRINLDRKVFDDFSVGVNVTANKSTQNSLTTFEGVNYNSSPFSKGIANSLTYALYVPPVVPVYSGNDYNYSNPFEYAYLREGETTANPVSDLKNSTAQTVNTVFLGNIYAQYHPVKELTVRLNAGENISHTTQNYFSPKYTAIGLEPDGIGGVGNKRTEILLTELTALYAKQLNDYHAFDVLAGFTYQNSKTNFITTQSAGFTNETLGINNLQDGKPYGKRPIFSGAGENNLYSILGRINYSLLQRYHLTANFRSDYSTRFAKNHKWGIFPSVGLSWNINEEEFLKNRSSVGNLKLRLSTGKVGNTEIGDYEYLQTLEAIRYNGETAYRQSNAGNDGLKWETTAQHNIGLDAGLFNNRITATVDLYYKKTSDLLLYIPPSLGQEDEQMVNVGNVTNRGIEFSIGSVIINNKNWHWHLDANIARNINTITKLNGDATEQILGTEILRVGESLGSFYGLQFEGVVQAGEDVSLLPTTPAYTVPQPGDPKFKDNKPDNHIDKNDRVVLGSKQPNFICGLSSTLNYRHFDLFVLFQGSQGGKVYNQLRRYLESPNDAYNASAALLDAWTPANPSNTVPRITSVPLSSELDSRYIEDASYLRLKTVTVGYSIPFKKNMKIRLFATFQNLFTLTAYKGYDPEIAKGLDLGAYPMARTFSMGANISF